MLDDDDAETESGTDLFDQVPEVLTYPNYVLLEKSMSGGIL